MSHHPAHFAREVASQASESAPKTNLFLVITRLSLESVDLKDYKKTPSSLTFSATQAKGIFLLLFTTAKCRLLGVIYHYFLPLHRSYWAL